MGYGECYAFTDEEWQTVIGATGNQGRSICNAFQSSGCWQVRALTRNPSGTQAQELQKAGVELIQGDWEKPAELAKAFDGAYAVRLKEQCLRSKLTGV